MPMSLEKLKKNNDNTAKNLVCFEVNPPKGADVSAIFEKLAGKLEKIDFLNITDNALARMKMSAIPFAALIKQKFGLEPLVNLACRDRNSLALQSDLLAGDALGVRSIIALTGDAMSVGNNPQAKPVFEMNSVGLLELIAKLNAGYELSGSALNSKTSIISGCVANPNAKNVDAEVRKLEKKIAAGASYALTQPVFDLEAAAVFVDKVKDLNIQVLLGLMPFASARAIEGVQKIPGIKISKALQDLSNSSDLIIKNKSIELSLEIVRENLGKIAGFHIISGANSALALDLAKEVCAVVKS